MFQTLAEIGSRIDGYDTQILNVFDDSLPELIEQLERTLSGGPVDTLVDFIDELDSETGCLFLVTEPAEDPSKPRKELVAWMLGSYVADRKISIQDSDWVLKGGAPIPKVLAVIDHMKADLLSQGFMAPLSSSVPELPIITPPESLDFRP